MCILHRFAVIHGIQARIMAANTIYYLFIHSFIRDETNHVADNGDHDSSDDFHLFFSISQMPCHRVYIYALCILDVETHVLIFEQ